ncbi:hypothetical protein HZA40_03000 [Candidatus Peregrinibacteria bacterium]|nr:hypothetical protein [Candidatus Peregrinibacteria bacterium]
MSICLKCKQNFDIRDTDREFYKKFGAPEPRMCPECRLQHKLCFRNERSLYKRTSSKSGKAMISIYPADAKYQVYLPEEWWASDHDAIQYGQDFDFSRPFFEQFNELLLKVPRIGLFNINPTNSDFCQQAYDNKNCYLSMVIEKCEDCMYVSHSNGLRDCYDCSFLHDCELCYQCLDSNKLYSCINTASCQNSSNLMFCYDCIGCHDCVGCYGLRNKSFYIMNEQYSKEAYEAKLKVLELNKYSKFLNCKAYFVELSKKSPHRASRNLNVENSSGNYLINCKNAHDCFDSFELEDCAYSTWIFNSHDCYDVYGLGHGAFVLEGLGVEAVTNCAFNTFVSDSSDVFYSDCCFHSMNLFGCASLRSKKYCILNKQYKLEEYEVMKAKIIEHMKKGGGWGQFFPVSLSPFAYNETASNYRFPLTKEKALKQGYRWSEEDPKEYLKQTYILEDDLKDVDGGVCEQILACANCGKNYKIMPKELAFYKKLSIPLPRKCTDCRFMERFSSRNPRHLWERKCVKCSKKITSTYSPERPEKVYCEECYATIVN